MQVLNIFHVLIAIAMIAFILIQKGAGATAGAAFGSGASGTVFGSRGAGNFLSRTTWVLATLFCLISLTMAVLASRASLTPETDLGVVATTPVTEEVTEQATPDMPIVIKACWTSFKAPTKSCLLIGKETRARSNRFLVCACGNTETRVPK